MRRSGATPVAPRGGLDYLAKDYASFLRLMLDTMAAQVPGWTERNPADLGVTVLEALAYAADHLSYRQDAIAGEAYLATARNRISVARHLRLLGYRLHQGCNARVWLRFALAPHAPRALVLAPGTAVASPVLDERPTLAADSTVPAPGPAATTPGSVFQTLHEATLSAALETLELHRESLEHGVLARGAASVVLHGHVQGLRHGDVILLQEAAAPGAPGGGRRHLARVGAPPRHRVARADGAPVTELALARGDELPFALGAKQPPREGAGPGVTVHGNLVLAEHGARVRETLGRLGERSGHGFTLARRDVLWGEPHDPLRARDEGAMRSLVQDPRRAVPRLWLLERARAGRPAQVWLPRRDLVDCAPDDPAFTLEVAEDGTARARFGDGVHGRRPPAQARFEAVYLVGDGGNAAVAEDVLSQLDPADPSPGDEQAAAALEVSNPVPGHGQMPPESVSRARVVAPHAARRIETLATADDCAAACCEVDGVVCAVARRHWTGAWHTDVVRVQRAGALPVDRAFRARLQAHLASRTVAGRDVAIRDAGWVEVDLALDLRVAAGRYPDAVMEAVRRRLLGAPGGHDPEAYFYPDRQRIGDPLYLDAVLDEVMSVPGVGFARARCFRALGADPGQGPVATRLDPGPARVVALWHAPGRAPLGRLRLSASGAGA